MPLLKLIFTYALEACVIDTKYHLKVPICFKYITDFDLNRFNFLNYLVYQLKLIQLHFSSLVMCLFIYLRLNNNLVKMKNNIIIYALELTYFQVVCI